MHLKQFCTIPPHIECHPVLQIPFSHPSYKYTSLLVVFSGARKHQTLLISLSFSLSSENNLSRTGIVLFHPSSFPLTAHRRAHNIFKHEVWLFNKATHPWEMSTMVEKKEHAVKSWIQIGNMLLSRYTWICMKLEHERKANDCFSGTKYLNSIPQLKQEKHHLQSKRIYYSQGKNLTLKKNKNQIKISLTFSNTY